MPTYRIFCEELDDYIIVNAEFPPLSCGPSGESIVNTKLTTIVRTTDAINTDDLIVQGIINKEITDPSNNVTANSLRLIGGDSINVTAPPPTTGQVLTALSATDASWLTLGSSVQYFDAYDSAGGTVINAGFVDIPLGTQRKITSDFTHVAGAAAVTINTTATYSIFYSCITTTTIGTVRSESESRLMINTGAGFVLVPGSVGTIYNRTLAQGTTSCSRTIILDITAGDIIKIQADRISGTATIATAAGGSSIVILKNEGAGPPGPTGPIGVPGNTTDALNTTGASVNVSLAAPPVVGDYLRATSATTAIWQGIDSESQILYVGKHGSDLNDGLTIDRALLTFSAAITAATALVPSTTNIIGIVCQDAGIYVEALTLIAFIFINAPNAKLEGIIVLADNTGIRFHTVENDGTFAGNTIFKIGTSGNAYADVKKLECIGLCNGFLNLGGGSNFYVNCDQLIVGTSVGVFDIASGSGHIAFNIGDICITGVGGRAIQSNFLGFGLNTTLGNVNRIIEVGAGIGFGTGILATLGTLNLTVNTLNCATAYTMTGTSSLHLIANEVIGERIATTTGTVNVFINKLGTGGSEIGSMDDLRLKYAAGGLIESQIAPTSLADADVVVTIAQILTRLLRMTPTIARIITLPTPAALVVGVNNAIADDSFDFSVVNESGAFTIDVDPDTGTTIGENTVALSSTGLFRVRITVITGGSEAYELYRI